MKSFFIPKLLRTPFRDLFRHTAVYRFARLGLFILLVISLVLALGTRGDARQPNMKQPKAAVIQDYERHISNNSKKLFQLILRGRTSSKVPVTNNASIGRGGGLLVPTDGKAWAQLYFLEDNNEKAYGGLTVKTRVIIPKPDSLRLNSYVFPCEFGEPYIIALRSGSAACGVGDGGIHIITDPGHTVKNKQSFKNKQNSTELRNDLVINPGQGQTVIRTSVDGTTSIPSYTEVCSEVTPEPGLIISGQRSSKPPIRKCEKVSSTISSEVVSIEVLEGDILVKTESNSVGEKVDKGKKYVYPRKEITSIDVAAKANTCEMLRFLNAAYWASPETPKSISDEIAEQLKQHREALGVSGRPPRDLSRLEQGVFDEVNRERKNLSLPPFSISEGMSRANRDHVNDQVGSGKYLGHSGDKSIGTGERLRRYGSVGCARYDEDEFENIVYFKRSSVQEVSTGQSVVKEMKSKYRPRRTGMKENLFNRDFQVVGVGCSSEMCVISYAEGYLEKTEAQVHQN